MSAQSKTAASHRLRLAVTVRQEDGYWLATAGKLDSYGTGDTPATAVESVLEQIIVRARMFREERTSLGSRFFGDLDAWERWCGGFSVDRPASLAGGTVPSGQPQ